MAPNTRGRVSDPIAALSGSQPKAPGFAGGYLLELMSRAKESSTGSIVNAVAYQDDLNTARANLRELRKAGEAKKCTLGPSTPAQ